MRRPISTAIFSARSAPARRCNIPSTCRRWRCSTGSARAVSPPRLPPPASASSCPPPAPNRASPSRSAAPGSPSPTWRRFIPRCRTTAGWRRCATARTSRRAARPRCSARPPPGMSTTSWPMPRRRRGCRRGRRLAYKTGTSYGYRDAWAVGYDAEATIAVWAGRPDGTPLPGQSGRATAAPVVFKIADLLGRPARAAPAPPPPGALIVSRQELPPRLRHLDPGPLAHRGAGGGPRILYPPDGATVAWSGGDLPLEAAGGRGPLRWLVDGRPLPPAPPRKPLYWQPEGIGFARLTVIDADGRSARATVRLSP